ncbi:MAG: cysteine-rich CWC family protein [Ignavibacteria bacterium]
MSLHETKYCPRCGSPFECKSGNITQCQCFEVELSAHDLQLMKEVYDDCLCKKCLLELKGKFRRYKNEVRLKFVLKHIKELTGHRN